MGDFHLRHAEPGQQFSVTLADGSVHDFAADKDGIVEPKTVEEDLVLREMGVPVARKAEQASKPTSKPSETSSGNGPDGPEAGGQD